MENDLSYFLRRAALERSAALNSRDVRARRSHKELADRYEDLARSLTESQRENQSSATPQLVANEH